MRDEFTKVVRLHVADVAEHLLVPHEHLTGAGDPWTVSEYELEIARIPRRQGHRLGPRANKRHVPEQHVHHLR